MSTPPRLQSRRVAAVLGAAALAVTLVGTHAADALTGQASGRAETARVAAVGKETVRLKIGAPNRTMPEEDLYKITLPKGHYEVQMNGLFGLEGTPTYANLGCLVIDKRLVAQFSDPDLDYRMVHAVDSMYYSSSGTSTWDSIIDSSNVITLTRARTIVYGCTAYTDGDGIKQLAPAYVHFTKLAGIDQRAGRDYTLPAPRPIAKGGALGRLFR